SRGGQHTSENTSEIGNDLHDPAKLNFYLQSMLPHLSKNAIAREYKPERSWQIHGGLMSSGDFIHSMRNVRHGLLCIDDAPVYLLESLGDIRAQMNSN
ncbi:MAG: hypothetical protein AAF978_08755, partial [Cyanobacteria bacterium P01_E01_bin.48]